MIGDRIYYLECGGKRINAVVLGITGSRYDRDTKILNIRWGGSPRSDGYTDGTYGASNFYLISRKQGFTGDAFDGIDNPLKGE